MVKAIVGANWGDEGKGKITDMMAETSDVVVRFQGGANAGHTIINDMGKFALHLLPSGVCYSHITNIIGNGVAFDPEAFLNELKSITEKGVPMPHILISERAQLLMPYHKLQDAYEEARLAGSAYGSTKSGIAPFYSDKYAKIGIQVCELFDEEVLRARVEKVCTLKNVLFEHLYHQPLLEPDTLMDLLHGWRDQLAPFVADTQAFVSQAVAAGKTVLLEGQLGTMRDPDFGIYPYTTSSHTLAGFGCVGVGVAPNSVEEVVAVTKAYSSAVGAGAFVCRLDGEEAETLRRRGGDSGEYGATTGRPRDVGYFDAVATRYGCRLQGATEVALTCLDVLGYLDEIPVCIGYEIDGQVTRDFPVTPKLNRAKPVYTKLPGWKTDVRGVTEWDKLPKEAQDYVLFLEQEIGVPIKIVSTGPKRHENIFR
jgi:adenylosuccinate synthase